MPRSLGKFAFTLAAALLVYDYATAAEGNSDAGDDRGQGHVDLSIESSGGKDQDHVDLSIDGAEGTAAGERSQDHVDFSADGSGSTAGGKEEGHVDLCIDPAGAYAVEADLVPGTGIAEICGFDGSAENVHVDFRITIRPDGRIDVNGQELATCDPAKGARISLTWCPGTGALVVQAEDATGAVCAAQYAMEGVPEGVSISAAEVSALSVQRQ